MKPIEETNRTAREFDKSEAEAKARLEDKASLWRTIKQLRVENKGLQAEVERLKEALERLASGEAMYIPMVIPKTIRREMIARGRFIELVLKGEEPKKAAKQACDEQAAKTEQALKGG